MNAESPAAKPTPSWLRGRFAGWVFATDHKRVGVLWLGVGAFGIALGGLLALIAAAQTARPDATVLGEGTFASVATMQGTLLGYAGVLPLALGLAVALVPLQIGARGLALPQLAALGLWLGVSGTVAVVLSSFAPGDAPRSSWTTVPGPALDPARPGESIRLMGLLLIGLAALLTAVSLVATLRTRRTPGMTDARLPLFTSAAGIFATALLVLAPVSMLGTLLLLLARGNPGSFDWYVDEDGSLLAGYGWVFQQGVVTIALVPALGVAAELVATFARTAFASRRLVVLALVAVAVLTAVVPSATHVAAHRWAAVLALVAVVPVAVVAAVLLPVGVQALRTSGATTPVPFALGSLLLALGGAVASVVLVVSHDDLGATTFETARLALLLGAALVALLGGVVYWWPKLFGRMLDARLTTIAALLLTAGLGLLGLGRALAGWQEQPAQTGVTIDDAGTAALVATVGLVAAAVGLLAFGLAEALSHRGRRVGQDPWLADTLEWYAASPPPAGNFDSLPPVESARPLDDLRRSLRERGAL